MPKMMLHDAEARAALARGVAKLTRAVSGTLGPKGMNAVMDRPLGTPIVSRDGVSIAAEIELEDPFENMGAQIVREVSKQTNDVAGDGTTTATVLADAMVQDGLKLLEAGANPVDLVEGLQLAVEVTVAHLKKRRDRSRASRACGRSPASPPMTTSSARFVAEAFEHRADRHRAVESRRDRGHRARCRRGHGLRPRLYLPSYGH